MFRTGVVTSAIVLTLSAVGCAATSVATPMGALDAVARALGGKDRVLGVRTLVVEGRGEQLNFGQNATPTADTKFEVTSYRWATDYAGQRHLIDVTRVPRFTTAVTTPQRIRLGLDGSVAYGVLPNGNMTRGNAQAAADRAHNPMFHPIGFLQAAYAAGTRVTDLGIDGGARLIRIDVGGRSYTMAIEASTNLPTRIETRVDQPMLGDVALVMDLLDYQESGGLRVPMRMVQRFENLFTLSDIRFTSVRINEDVGSIAATDSIRAVVLPASPPSPVIAVDTLAPGVWSIAGQTHHTIAIEQANGLVLIEAPQSDARALAAIAKGRELRAGKPIIALVNTHHHFDHAGGIRAAMSQDLTIITHQTNRDFYERIVYARPHTIAPDALARSPKALRVIGVADKHVLPDPQRPVELYHVPNPHSGSMLVAYLPAERILIQADLYNPPAPNAPPPPAFPFAKSLLDDIQRRGLQVDRIVGIHGRPVLFSDFQAAATRTP
jgi:glyoxylase-like metal-dependent hydrolase (beta-lactamase superfamily II)